MAAVMPSKMKIATIKIHETRMRVARSGGLL